MTVQHQILIVATLSVLFGCDSVFGQNFDCNFKGDKGYYDLSPLSGSQISGQDSAGNWNYFLNMCGVASGTSALPCTGTSAVGAMVCQIYRTPSLGTFAIAYPNDQTGTHVWSDTAIPNGIQLVAYGISASGCPSNTKVAQIQITCDPNAQSVPTAFTSSVVEITSTCTYTMQLKHVSACPSSTPPPTPGSDGGSSGISGGTVFIIVLLVGSFVYVAGGCFYKRYKKGTTGMIESCPNNEFWTGLPGLIKDGFSYTVQKVRGLCGGSSSSKSGGTGSYESI